ncbi:putative RNA-binding motif protein [Rosa chinensis]|uniref:RNA-binding protein 8A n=1 Tax=Rosa chinensis TaxID=74649 RepID=A0A2P6QFS5_ROSCH|nr:RNA-binding protein Y14A [Rosa chinensis]PRQ33035.1 putative RNA-binding motif protein [Rosa chinensis]
MANNADVEAVDFEPEDDDLMDEDGAVDAEPAASPRAPLPKLKSAITGASSASLSAPKKTKGRGFREDPNAERNTRLAVSDLDGLNALDGLEPQRSIEGWIILVTGIHEEAQEDDLHATFGEFGEIKNLHLNLDRRTGFVKGYALIEYENFAEAQAAISRMDGNSVLTQIVNVDWAFSNGSFLDGSKKKNPRQLRDRRSRSPPRRRF